MITATASLAAFCAGESLWTNPVFDGVAMVCFFASVFIGALCKRHRKRMVRYEKIAKARRVIDCIKMKDGANGTNDTSGVNGAKRMRDIPRQLQRMVSTIPVWRGGKWRLVHTAMLLKGKSWHWAGVPAPGTVRAYTSNDKCNSKCKTYMRGEIVQQPSSLNNSLEMLDGQSGYHRLFIMEETPLVTSLSEYLNRSDEQSIFQLKKVTMKRSMVPKVILLVLASFCINTARAIFIAEHRTFACRGAFGQAGRNFMSHAIIYHPA